MAAQLKTPAGGRTNPTFWAAAICRLADPGSPCIAPADSLQSAIIATHKPTRPGLQSRGHLVTEFLRCDASPFDYLQSINSSDYSGFNLLVSDGDSLSYLSNRDGEARELAPGIYGLSNATLDTPWDKVERSKRGLQELVRTARVNETSLMRLLGDRDKGPVDEVRSERLPFATAHAITAPFVVLPEYGTRCSTVVLADRSGRWSFLERRFDSNGNRTGESQHSFERVDRL